MELRMPTGLDERAWRMELRRIICELVLSLGVRGGLIVVERHPRCLLNGQCFAIYDRLQQSVSVRKVSRPACRNEKMSRFVLSTSHTIGIFAYLRGLASSVKASAESLVESGISAWRVRGSRRLSTPSVKLGVIRRGCSTRRWRVCSSESSRC